MQKVLCTYYTLSKFWADAYVVYGGGADVFIESDTGFKAGAATDCADEPEVGSTVEPDAAMSVELVIGLIGADTGLLFDTGTADVVVVSDAGLNTSAGAGTDAGCISGTLIIEVGIVICCGAYCEEGIERSKDPCSEYAESGIKRKTIGFRCGGLSNDGSGWELSYEFDEGNGRDTGGAMGIGGNDK